MEKEMEDPGGTASTASREKTKNGAEFRRTGEDEGAKAGGPTIKAARKTAIRRDGGESLSS